MIRGLAKQIAKEDWREYLRTAENDFFEETMLQGLVIGYAKADIEEILAKTPESPRSSCSVSSEPGFDILETASGIDKHQISVFSCGPDCIRGTFGNRAALVS